MDNHFDKIASEFDTDVRKKRAVIIAKEMNRRIPIKENWNILEFGCGTGLISFSIYQNNMKFTLIDQSEKMIEVAIRKAKNLGIDNMHIEKMDLNSPKLESNHFNLIFASMVLHHIVEINDIIRRFSDLSLVNKGYVCIIDLNKNDGNFHKDEPNFDGHNGFDPRELEKIGRSFGLKKYYQDTFYHNSRNVNGMDVDYSLFILVMKRYK
jgi:ubiquinone/menaquinone biosynthesis C-methylase UbiE